METHRETIRGCGRLTKAFYDNLQNQTSERLTSRDLTTERSKLEHVTMRVLTAMEEISSMAQFFEKNHLAQVSEWASGYDGDGARYEALPTGLVRKAGGSTAVIALPSDFALPDDKLIRDFGREVNASTLAIAA